MFPDSRGFFTGRKKTAFRRHLSQVYRIKRSWSLIRSEKRSKPWLHHPFAQSGLTSLNFSYLTSWDLSFFQLSPLRHSCNHFSNIFICGSRMSRKWDPLVLECRFPDPQWSSPNPTSSGVLEVLTSLFSWAYDTRKKSLVQEAEIDKNHNLNLYRTAKIVWNR